MIALKKMSVLMVLSCGTYSYAMDENKKKSDICLSIERDRKSIKMHEEQQRKLQSQYFSRYDKPIEKNYEEKSYFSRYDKNPKL